MPTLRELQTTQPWTVPYSQDFRATPTEHKDFGHAVLHAMKSLGRLAAVVEKADHGEVDFSKVDKDLASLVVCAIRMANRVPGQTLDLEDAVLAAIESKNSPGAKPPGGYVMRCSMQGPRSVMFCKLPMGHASECLFGRRAGQF